MELQHFINACSFSCREDSMGANKRQMDSRCTLGKKDKKEPDGCAERKRGMGVSRGVDGERR